MTRVTRTTELDIRSQLHALVDVACDLFGAYPKVYEDLPAKITARDLEQLFYELWKNTKRDEVTEEAFTLIDLLSDVDPKEIASAHNNLKAKAVQEYPYINDLDITPETLASLRMTEYTGSTEGMTVRGRKAYYLHWINEAGESINTLMVRQPTSGMWRYVYSLTDDYEDEMCEDYQAIYGLSLPGALYRHDEFIDLIWDRDCAES
jgi:hypothetical protein